MKKKAKLSKANKTNGFSASKSISSEPSFDALHQQKVAETYVASGDLDRAIAACQQAIQLHPSFAVAYKTLGNIYLSQGDLVAASSAYHQAIELDSTLAEPYANLGNIAAQTGQIEQAIIFYRQAIALKPSLAGAHWMLGNALSHQGQTELAFSHYNKALELKPRLVSVNDLFKLATATASQKHLNQAAIFYRQVITLQANHAEAYCELGFVLLQLHKLDDALAYLQRAIELRPNYTDAYCNLGAVLGQQRKLDAAIAALQTSVKLNPASAEAHCNLGTALSQHKKYTEAIACFETALQLKPNLVEALYNLSDVLLKVEATAATSQYLQSAIAHLKKVIDLHPNHAKAHYSLGCIYSNQGHLAEAIVYSEQAIALQPNFAEAYSTLSSILFQQGNLEQAKIYAQQAISLQPNFAEAYCNLGASLSEQSKFEEAITAYTKAIELYPDDATTHLNLGMTLLTVGNFERGWTEYEWRWQTAEIAEVLANFPQSRWHGADLKGKTLLVWAEQGLGDTLQFIRYIPMVAKLCDRIILRCPANLIRLLSSLPNISRIVSDSEPLPEFDAHVPLLSLPSIFKTNLQTIPVSVPYLSTVYLSDSLTYQLQASPDTKLKIGFVWSSGYRSKPSLLKVHYLKSCPLELFAQLLEIPNIDLYSLQIGKESEHLMPYLSDRCQDLSGHIQDFADTANLISQLDLVISVDTSVSHLAGAMAKPVWMLLPYAADWRWLLNRDDSPWYPTMRLFRQPQPGDWQSIFALIQQALSEPLTFMPEGR